MHRLHWYLLGAVSLLLLFAALGAGLVLRNARGFSAREQPTQIEALLARAARSAAIPAGARDRANPVPKTQATIDDARAHWADHCALCHGNDGAGDTQLGRHTYPPAPDMRLPATQRLSDGELFYFIQNGIRLSAMPAWGEATAHDEESSWKLVHFIRHLSRLTDAEKREMQKLNPKSPDELKEEKEEEEFLKGGETNEKPIPDHHR